MRASEFWRSIKSISEQTVSRYTPFRAKATSVNNSGVQIQTYDADTPLGERYAKLRGPDIAIGDEVAVIPYGGSNLVLGSVGDGPSDHQDNVLYRGTSIDPVRTFLYQTDNSLTPSTTVTVTHQPACSFNISLDNGTWSITAIGGFHVRHLTSDFATSYVIINGGFRKQNRISTNWSTAMGTYVGNVTVTNGTASFNMTFNTGISGGMETSAPWVMAVARRIA